MTTILVSHSAQYKDHVINEILNISPMAKISEQLCGDVTTFILNETYSNFILKYNGCNLIFAHHIFCSEITDYNIIVEKIKDILDIQKQYKFHYRYNDEYKDKAISAINNIDNYMKENDLLNNKAELQLNIYFDKKIYYGINLNSDTLSPWNSGIFRYKKNENFISRSEFKLQEIIELTGLKIDGSVLALDLGAAPGGWSKILAEYGAHVISIDPAELDSRVLKMPNIEHFKGTTQAFNHSKDTANLITNDMRMDAVKSCVILCELSNILKRNGKAIITLKLPNTSQKKVIKSCNNILNKSYSVKLIRHLYHNRNEVTVFLEKLEE